MKMKFTTVVALLLLHLVGSQLEAKQRGQVAAPVTGKTAAPIDLTGYWVSLVTSEWRWRMLTPARVTTRHYRLMLKRVATPTLGILHATKPTATSVAVMAQP